MLFRIKSLSFLAVILNICVSAFGSPTASITSSSSCRVPAICGDGYSAQWQEIELGSAKVGPPAGPRRGLKLSNDFRMRYLQTTGQPATTGYLDPSFEARLSALERKLEQAEQQISRITGAKEWNDAYEASNGYQYLLVSNVDSYRVGELVCRSLGSHVAYVGMRNETVFREIMLMVVRFQSKIYIGLTDLSNEGVFVWGDGLPASEGWTNWQEGEPNNFDDEDCARIRYADGLWNDKSCAQPGQVLCERRKPTEF